MPKIKIKQNLAYLGKSEQNEDTVGGSGSTTPGKYFNSYYHLSLETVFPALKLTQNCYIKNISFSWKLAIYS